MVLYLTESDVQELLPMDRALECVEASFRALAADKAVNRARARILLPHCSLHYMAAALPEEHRLGMKIYTVTRGDARFIALLFDTESGALLSIMQADHLGRLRTGAASGVATKYLARPEASRVGLIGTGRQAWTQLEAVARVRKLTATKVFSRNEQHRENFCRDARSHPFLAGVAVEPARSAEEAARFGDVVITATTSHNPVVQGDWLQAGAHVNAIGANMPSRRELDDAALARAAVIAVDSIEQARMEAGDLIQGLSDQPGAQTRGDRSKPGWDRVGELHSIVAGKTAGRRSPEDITIFKSVGIAVWDVAVAEFIYRQALLQGRGKKLDLE